MSTSCQSANHLFFVLLLRDFLFCFLHFALKLSFCLWISFLYVYFLHFWLSPPRYCPDSFDLINYLCSASCLGFSLFIPACLGPIVSFVGCVVFWFISPPLLPGFAFFLLCITCSSDLLVRFHSVNWLNIHNITINSDSKRWKTDLQFLCLGTTSTV